MSKPKPPKGHHVVPACYLKNFAIPANRNGELSVLDRKINTWRVGTPNSECKENHYNTIEGDCEPHAYEDFLASIETQCSAILDEVIRTANLPSNFEGLDKLLTFIGLLQARGQAFRDVINDATEKFFRDSIRSNICTPENFEAMLPKIGISEEGFSESVTKEQVRQRMLEGVDSIKATIHNNFYIEQMHKLMDELMPVYHSKLWRIVRTTSSEELLITSDSPVCTVGIDATPYKAAAGSNLVVMVALSPSTALLGDFKRDIPVQEMDEFVRWMNLKTLEGTRRFIYATNPSFRFGTRTTGVVRSEQLLPQS